jgi:hypothetical protein
MSTIVSTITHTLELLLVFLATLVGSATVMGLFGGISPTEMWLALSESVAAAVLWAKYFQRPA